MAMERRTRAEVFAAGVAIAAWPFVITEPVPPHVHDFIELALVTGGSARYRTSDGTALLGAGDVVAVRPGTWHAYAPAGGEPFAVTNAYLGPEMVHGSMAWLLDYPRLARLLLVGGRLRGALSPAATTRVAGWLAQLAEEQDRPDPGLNAALLGCALVEISRAEERQFPVAPPAISEPVRTALQAMTDDLAWPWTVPELGGRAGLSVSSLYRQFRDQLGSGPVEWLTRARAEAAATLLVQTDLSISAVGRRVGWPDPSYTSRRFAQVYEVSPTAYRAVHGGRPTSRART
jgi:AraC family L-rhamnose operon transcriptional activator RhaR